MSAIIDTAATAPIDTPIMRYHGGKFRLAPWITSHFPEHQVYVEAFGGSVGVLLQKPRVKTEVYNDLNDEIVNVYRVLRDMSAAAELARLCQLTPYARSEYELSQEPTEEPIERARRTLFPAWAGFGSASATRGRSGMRTVTRPDRRYSPVARSRARLADMIPRFTARLTDVIVESRPAVHIMGAHHLTHTLHCVDPPYLPETRSVGSSHYYRHEMSVVDHEALLASLGWLDGMVVLSGNDSGLYHDALPGWQQVTQQTAASGKQGSVSRTECLWLNPTTQRQTAQMSFFDTATGARADHSEVAP